jgi:hypothetical protein
LDINADRIADLAIGNRDTLGLGLFPGDGAGGLNVCATLPVGSFPQALGASSQTPQASALRLASLNVKSNSISALAWSDGRLSALPEVACGFEPRAARIAELTGAAGSDLMCLVAGQRGSDLQCFEGAASGRLSLSASLELGFVANDLALIDIDRDGVFELAVCDPNAGRVLLLESDGAHGDPAALERAAQFAANGVPLTMTAIELDDDPALELAVIMGPADSRRGIAWLDAGRDSNGNLVLTELGFTHLPGAPNEAVACDLNGDGLMDLAVLVTRATDSPVGAWYALLRGRSGPADFKVCTPIGMELGPRGITAGDVNGDGRAEVFVAVQNSTLVQAWTPLPTDDSGQFRVRELDPLGAGRGPLDLCMADVDGDGLLDLCVANAFSNDVSVLFATRP